MAAKKTKQRTNTSTKDSRVTEGRVRARLDTRGQSDKELQKTAGRAREEAAKKTNSTDRKVAVTAAADELGKMVAERKAKRLKDRSDAHKRKAQAKRKTK